MIRGPKAVFLSNNILNSHLLYFSREEEGSLYGSKKWLRGPNVHTSAWKFGVQVSSLSLWAKQLKRQIWPHLQIEQVNLHDKGGIWGPEKRSILWGLEQRIDRNLVFCLAWPVKSSCLQRTVVGMVEINMRKVIGTRGMSRE